MNKWVFLFNFYLYLVLQKVNQNQLRHNYTKKKTFFFQVTGTMESVTGVTPRTGQSAGQSNFSIGTDFIITGFVSINFTNNFIIAIIIITSLGQLI